MQWRNLNYGILPPQMIEMTVLCLEDQRGIGRYSKRTKGVIMPSSRYLSGPLASDGKLE